MNVSEEQVVIAIPTFRRPATLLRLLESLRSEAAAAVTIVVCDNDCNLRIRDLVAGQCETGLPVHYVAVPERGLSAVRNALVAAANAVSPGWRWLAMLDDDGYVIPGWLECFISCAERHAADLAGGPVTGVLPEAANLLARNSVFAARRRWTTGPVPTLNTTQNLLISRSLLARLASPLFDGRYGLSGGEDYELFRRASKAGARLVWCDEAEVFEPAPADRLTRWALLHRYFSTGMYMGLIDRDHDGLPSALRAACRGLGGATLQVMRGGVSRDGDRLARGLLTTAHHLGRLRGLTGARASRYQQRGDT